LRVLNIAIDADGSPSGYISWHNHFNKQSKIRLIKPSLKNEKFGIQRMEMLAIFFAISDNLKTFKKIKRTRQIVIEQLNNKAQINDKIIQRISDSIKRILQKISFIIVFDHLNRTRNRAGRLLEKVFRNNLRYINKKHNTTKTERQFLQIQYKKSNLKCKNTFSKITKPLLMH
jgi:hypothetical protein